MNKKINRYRVRIADGKPLLILIALLISISIGCRKLVDVPAPINIITDEDVYSTDATATSILTGLYVSMSQPQTGGFIGINGIQIATSLSADELFLNSVGVDSKSRFFQNTLVNNISQAGPIWKQLYNYVYRCNAAIDGLKSSQTLSRDVKQQLIGEALFLRAFSYFHLVNLFGPVPLATSSDYKVNILLVRAPENEVYDLIINDLKQSQAFLSEQFQNGGLNGTTIERIRPSKWAATALLARVYLYKGDYANSAVESSLIINNGSLFNLPPLNEVFWKNSPEAIWQLQPVNSLFNTEDAKIFIIPLTGFDQTFNPFYLNPSLLNSFESGDQRRFVGTWVGETILDGTSYFFPYKYKANVENSDIIPENGSQFMTEYFMVLRLGEQYLIRSEALANQGMISEAISDLDAIRSRAGLPLISVTNPDISQTELLDLIFHERQVELFTESCHRWFDLKRTGRIDSIMSIETQIKGGIWESREALYPISKAELQRAPNLVQNPGYPDF